MAGFIKTSQFHTKPVCAVNLQQSQIAELNAQIGPVEATASELNARIITMERGRAAFHEDLDEIVRLAGEKVYLSGVNHGGNLVTVDGTVSDEDDIFSYARDLRNDGRFSNVWIYSITESGIGFTFTFTLLK